MNILYIYKNMNIEGRCVDDDKEFIFARYVYAIRNSIL